MNDGVESGPVLESTTGTSSRIMLSIQPRVP